MARKAIGLSSSSIKWSPEDSSLEESETGEVTVSAVGYLDARGLGAEAAALLIPDTLPISATGPIGFSSRLSGAKRATRSANNEGGTWVLRATYKKAGGQTSTFPDGTKQSGSDRAERRIAVSNEPILSHPVALDFPLKDKTYLAALLQGAIIANPKYDGEEDEDEFVRIEDDGSRTGVEFSSSPVTVGGISASPLDYARLIKAGITTYQRKAIRHAWMTTRDNPAPDAEYRAVGAIVTSPPLSPSLSGGFQWMLVGISDTTDNGDTWNSTYEYEASGAGGYLKEIYKGGTASVSS